MKTLPPIERTHSGTLPRMTPRQKQAALKLIKSGCRNFSDGNCLMLDDETPNTCTQSISYSVNCKLFRWALLEDKDGLKLRAELFRDETVKQCAVCKNFYQSKSNNAKYCADCAKLIQGKQKAAHARKRRARVEK